MDPILLASAESVPRRPFTAISLYRHDRAVLALMLAELRDRLPGLAASPDWHPFEPREWSLDGRRHRNIVGRLDILFDPADVCVVGFFGQRRLHLDGEPLEEANREIVLDFRNHLGILSYSSIELRDGNWANLILHDVPEVRENWRSSEAHARAARELSPIFYRTVRIHNGLLRGGLPGGAAIEIDRTKYWDYRRRGQVWHAIRELRDVTTHLAH